MIILDRSGGDLIKLNQQESRWGEIEDRNVARCRVGNVFSRNLGDATLDRSIVVEQIPPNRKGPRRCIDEIKAF